MYTDTISTVKYLGRASDPIKNKIRFGQEDKLSSFIFNLVLEKVIRIFKKIKGITTDRLREYKIHLNCLVCVDDLAIFSNKRQDYILHLEKLH